MLTFILFLIIGGTIAYCLVRYPFIKPYFIAIVILTLVYFTFNKWNNFLSPTVLDQAAYLGTAAGALIGSLMGFKFADNL